MFIVLMTFAENKALVDEYMGVHGAWVKQGIDEGVFLLAGTMKSGSGGAIMAFNTSLSALQNRVSKDPFVVNDIVTAEIVEIEPRLASEKLAFLVP